MKNLIKSVLLITLFTLSLTASAVDVKCAKIGRYTRAAGPNAEKVLDYLKLKTCDSKRFKSFIKAKGATLVIIKATPELIAKHNKPSEKSLNGFDF